MDSSVLVYMQFFLTVIMGFYFWNLLRNQETHRFAVGKESKKELERLRQLRSIRLTQPLTEKTRPAKIEEIIGQEDGMKALKAALCGPNPQHVLIYGPPGVGKTAAARLVLEEAKKNPLSPFKADACFVEVDATISRFDERGIADPLIGSVHDPIYQGAGPLGISGIPQPKPGAVTKAHGGILFLDEIGELHPVQMQKLLKVLEDRRVFLESAYYSKDDANIPEYIHDIFQNGLPADFRLVGATTRSPEEISPALKSRCVEVFFRDLSPDEIGLISIGAAGKAGVKMEDGAVDLIRKYAANGRDAVNMVELGAGLAMTAGKDTITKEDMEWVVSQGRHTPRPMPRIPEKPSVGVALALAVYGPGMAAVIDVETRVVESQGGGKGQVTITGIIEEEEMGKGNHTLRRKSMVLSSIENVRTALTRYSDPQWYDAQRPSLHLRALSASGSCTDGANSDDGTKLLFAPYLNPYNCHIHVNFPGGTPVDGPSAGLAIAVSMYSAMTSRPADPKTAFSGEVSIRGEIRPVGGIVEKVRAAKEAGLSRVFVPKGNWQERFRDCKISVVPVEHIDEVLLQSIVFNEGKRAN